MKTYLLLPVLVMLHLSPGGLSGANINHHRHPRSVPEYKIDIFSIVDWKMFDHWTEFSGQSASVVETNIRKYIALLIKGVNQRYSNIQNIKLSVSLADLLIFKDKATAQITPTDSILNFVSANTTLYTLANYVRNNGLTNYDHVMLFTGHDIYSTDNGALFRYTTGQAFVGTMCEGQQGNSISVIEDRGGFQSVLTAAHELAHSLKAVHDGSENSCKQSDRYIMAAGSSNVTQSNMFNPWFFSTCSVQEISTFLADKISTHAACLTTAMVSNPSNVPDVAYEEMGQLYSPDVLCQHVYGSGSYYCRSIESESAICHSLYCLEDTLLGRCNQHHAPDFTPCGDKKWCENGQCVSSVNAPSKNPSCVHGDEPSSVLNGKTCTALIEESSAYCYNNTTRLRCCQTCLDVASSVQGCEYGDKKTGCRPDVCNVIQPNGDIVDESCCRTCNFRPAEWTCQDVSTPEIDCSTLPVYRCYDMPTAFQCCATCSAARVKEDTGCEYGDKADNCDVLTSRGRSCDDQIKPFCCKTCAPTDTGVSAQSHVTVSVEVILLTILASLMLQ